MSSQPSLAPAPVATPASKTFRPGAAIGALGVLCVVVALVIGLLLPALYTGAAGGLFAGGCVLFIGGRILDALAAMSSQSTYVAQHAQQQTALLEYLTRKGDAA